MDRPRPTQKLLVIFGQAPCARRVTGQRRHARRVVQGVRRLEVGEVSDGGERVVDLRAGELGALGRLGIEHRIPGRRLQVRRDRARIADERVGNGGIKAASRARGDRRDGVLEPADLKLDVGVARDLHDADRKRDAVAAHPAGEAFAVPPLVDRREHLSQTVRHRETVRQHLRDLAVAGGARLHRGGSLDQRARAGRDAREARLAAAEVAHEAHHHAAGIAEDERPGSAAHLDLVAEHAREYVGVDGAPDVVKERRVIGLGGGLLVQSKRFREPDRVDGAAQAVFERHAHAQVGGEREHTEHLGDANAVPAHALESRRARQEVRVLPTNQSLTRPEEGSRVRKGLLAAALVLSLAPAVVKASAPGAVTISVISSRADLVSGGSAVVAISQPARVSLNGTDVTRAFAVRPNRRFEGLITGLHNGVNELTAILPDGRGARLAITNHPNGGPLFAGPQLQPWKCEAGARDAQCNKPATYTYLYKSTDPTKSDLQPYDPAKPPTDVATTTTDQGVKVPFIARQETGYQDRDQYTILTLFRPGQTWSRWAPPAQWNHKLLVTHGGGCGATRGAGGAPLEDYSGTFGPNIRKRPELLRR